MISKFLATATLTGLASAQLYSSCNPVKGDACDPNPAIGSAGIDCDLTAGKTDGFTILDGTSLTYDETKGAVFNITTENDAPTISSTNYMFFGRVDVTMRAAPGIGIVTAITLQSDDLDEIDWEWVGGSTAQAQSNFFSKGNVATYDRAETHAVSDAMASFHTYSLDWTTDSLQWIIDGKTVRTLLRSDVGDSFPQTPMQVRLGTWVAGKKSSGEGLVSWAGGLTDFNEAPFVAYYKSVTVTDYSNRVEGATAYEWTDSTGSSDSINVQSSKDENATTSSAIENNATLTSEAATSKASEATTTSENSETISTEAAIGTSVATQTTSEAVGNTSTKKAESSAEPSAPSTLVTPIESASITTTDVAEASETGECEDEEDESSAPSVSSTTPSEPAVTETENCEDDSFPSTPSVVAAATVSVYSDSTTMVVTFAATQVSTAPNGAVTTHVTLTSYTTFCPVVETTFTTLATLTTAASAGASGEEAVVTMTTEMAVITKAVVTGAAVSTPSLGSGSSSRSGEGGSAGTTIAVPYPTGKGVVGGSASSSGVGAAAATSTAVFVAAAGTVSAANSLVAVVVAFAGLLML